MNANLKLGFDFDTLTADEAHELRYAESADRSEVAGENGIYLDDELTARGNAGILTVLWTFKGSVLLRHRPTGTYLLATNASVTAAGWRA